MKTRQKGSLRNIPARELACLTAVCIFTAFLVMASPDPKPAPAKPATSRPVQVLLVTGVDWPGHPWKQTGPALQGMLEADQRFQVRLCEDPHLLESSSVTNYDVVILHFMNWECPAPGAAARENLERLVARGGGLVLVHFACGAWQDWPGFAKLAGRVWDPKLRPHDPKGPFRVEIIDPNHPITRGLAGFETHDELYTCLAGETPIHVLAAAKSKVDGKDYPMAFVHEPGKGRVFHTLLGHDVKALTNAPAVSELMRRGCAWAAGLEVVASRQH